MTRHQYGISAFVPQTSFRWETSCGVTKCLLFPPATEDFSHLKANERNLNFKTAYPTSVYVFKIVSCSPWTGLCLIYGYFKSFSGTGLPFLAVLSVRD